MRESTVFAGHTIAEIESKLRITETPTTTGDVAVSARRNSRSDDNERLRYQIFQGVQLLGFMEVFEGLGGRLSLSVMDPGGRTIRIDCRNYAAALDALT